jgi:hypothetical protein
MPHSQAMLAPLLMALELFTTSLTDVRDEFSTVRADVRCDMVAFRGFVVAAFPLAT